MVGIGVEESCSGEGYPFTEGKQTAFLPSARQDLCKLMFCLWAVKSFVKTQDVAAFGRQLRAWQRVLPDEVRGEAEDAAGLQLETSFHGYLARL